jgi:MFS family permease
MPKTVPPPSLLFAVFLDLAGFSMILPDIQTRLESFGAQGVIIGLTLSSYFLVQLVVSPWWGRASDRIGRKYVLTICGLLSAGSLFLYGAATDIWWIVASRILAGFAAANVAVAQAYIADLTLDDARTAGLGKLSAAITTGLLLGPALGGYLASVGGNRLLGSVAGGAALLGAVWIWLTLPTAPPRKDAASLDKAPPEESAGHVQEKAFSPKKGSGLLSLLKEAPTLRFLFGLSLTGMLALAILEGTFGRLIAHRLGYGPREFGLIFAFESLVSTIVQYFLLARLTGRFSSRSLLLISYLAQGAGLALTPFAPHLIALFGCSLMYSLGVSVSSPILSSLSSRAAPESRQGELFGWLQGARSVGFLAGPILGGILFDWHPEAPYLLAGVILLTAALIAFLAKAGAGIGNAESPP